MLKIAVALAWAFIILSAVASIVTYPAVERAWTIKQEPSTMPPPQTTDLQLHEEQLRKILLNR